MKKTTIAILVALAIIVGVFFFMRSRRRTVDVESIDWNLGTVNLVGHIGFKKVTAKFMKSAGMIYDGCKDCFWVSIGGGTSAATEGIVEFAISEKGKPIGEDRLIVDFNNKTFFKR
jgi:hypothetical protein